MFIIANKNNKFKYIYGIIGRFAKRCINIIKTSFLFLQVIYNGT